MYNIAVVCSVTEYYEMRFVNTTPSGSSRMAAGTSVTYMTMSKSNVILLAVLATVVAVVVVVVLSAVIVCVWRRSDAATSRRRADRKSKAGYYSPPMVEKLSADIGKCETAGT